jgi:hypothetical protein
MLRKVDPIALEAAPVHVVDFDALGLRNNILAGFVLARGSFTTFRSRHPPAGPVRPGPVVAVNGWGIVTGAVREIPADATEEETVADAAQLVRLVALREYARVVESAAAGQPFDAPCIGTSAERLEAAVALARKTAEWLATVDKLPSAKNQAGEAESALRIEGEKSLAAAGAYAEKAAGLQFELDEAKAAIRNGIAARERLLDPRNVPNAIAAEDAEAVAEARAAETARSDAESPTKELNAKLSSAADSRSSGMLADFVAAGEQMTRRWSGGA